MLNEMNDYRLGYTEYNRKSEAGHNYRHRLARMIVEAS